MNHKTRAILVGLFMTSVIFAGCTDEGQGTDSADPEDPRTLQIGKGAIAGLLVDDRYRPIQLVEGGPGTEFQDVGFILVQETAQQVLTNENGEFTITDLAPGPYTLRLQADNHEAISRTVQVTEGKFAEVTVEARRVISDAGAILSVENSMYIPCAVDYVANGGALPCDGDLAADSYREYFTSDYSGYGEEVSYMIVEMLANQESGWEIQVRGSQDGGESTTYFAAELGGGDYVRMQLQRGVNAQDHQDNIGYAERYGAWENVAEFDTIVFVDHPHRDTIQDADPIGFFCCGVGFTMGVKAKFLQSVFLGAPEQDIDTFCVLCE